MVPTANNSVTFAVSGPGKLVGVDNGDPIDLTAYSSPTRKAFNGKALAIVQSTGSPGQITVTATSSGLTAGSVSTAARVKPRIVHHSPSVERPVSHLSPLAFSARAIRSPRAGSGAGGVSGMGGSKGGIDRRQLRNTGLGWKQWNRGKWLGSGQRGRGRQAARRGRGRQRGRLGGGGSGGAAGGARPPVRRGSRPAAGARHRMATSSTWPPMAMTPTPEPRTSPSSPWPPRRPRFARTRTRAPSPSRSSSAAERTTSARPSSLRPLIREPRRHPSPTPGAARPPRSAVACRSTT